MRDVAAEFCDLFDEGGAGVAELLVWHDEQGFHLRFQMAVHQGHVEFELEVGQRAQAADDSVGLLLHAKFDQDCTCRDVRYRPLEFHVPLPPKGFPLASCLQQKECGPEFCRPGNENIRWGYWGDFPLGLGLVENPKIVGQDGFQNFFLGFCLPKRVFFSIHSPFEGGVLLEQGPQLLS